MPLLHIFCRLVFSLLLLGCSFQENDSSKAEEALKSMTIPNAELYAHIIVELTCYNKSEFEDIDAVILALNQNPWPNIAFAEYASLFLRPECHMVDEKLGTKLLSYFMLLATPDAYILPQHKPKTTPKTKVSLYFHTGPLPKKYQEWDKVYKALRTASTKETLSIAKAIAAGPYAITENITLPRSARAAIHWADYAAEYAQTWPEFREIILFLLDLHLNNQVQNEYPLNFFFEDDAIKAIERNLMLAQYRNMHEASLLSYCLKKVAKPNPYVEDAFSDPLFYPLDEYTDLIALERRGITKFKKRLKTLLPYIWDNHKEQTIHRNREFNNVIFLNTDTLLTPPCGL